MNVYDFDKTICKDDSETDFFFYELRHRPINWFSIPRYTWAWILHKLDKISIEEYRHRTYRILKYIKDLDKEVIKFWKKRKKKILPWYLKQQKEDDVIVSATQRFLLEPILIALNIKHYIVSEFDPKTRRVIGRLNYGEEKLRRFKEIYPNAIIDRFYTDSLSDVPLLLVAKEAYLVNKKYVPVRWENKN